MADTDPEARLQVGADMRKIQLCFQLLKVHHHVLHPCINIARYVLMGLSSL